MEQKDYWNRAAADKEFTTPFQLDAFEKYAARDALVLDVGCGYGRTLDELYRAGWRSLIGIDFSEAMIERTRRLSALGFARETQRGENRPA